MGERNSNNVIQLLEDKQSVSLGMRNGKNSIFHCDFCPDWHG